MSGRAPTVCSVHRCTADAISDGKCDEHQRAAWNNRSASSYALAGSAEHRRERASAVERSGNRCEICEVSGTVRPLQLHHPHPIAAGGGIVQLGAMLLCSGPGSCHASEQAVSDAAHDS